MAQPAQRQAAPAPAQQPQAPAGLARPVIVPPDFSGSSSDDWPTFIARFNAASAVNGYGQAERLRFLPCCLKDSAFTTLEAVQQANPNFTFQQVCDELAARFNPPQQSRLVEAEFRARTKRSTETQGEYASALQRLANRAFPGQQGPLFERLLVNQFIDGQPSSELRLHIRTSVPADLNAAVRRALEVSSILDIEQQRAGVTTGTAFAVSASSERAAAAPATQTDPLLLSLLTKISDKLDQLSVTSQQPATAGYQPGPVRQSQSNLPPPGFSPRFQGQPRGPRPSYSHPPQNHQWPQNRCYNGRPQTRFARPPAPQRFTAPDRSRSGNSQ